jgi:undecaprenyl-diphosphatase
VSFYRQLPISRGFSLLVPDFGFVFSRMVVTRIKQLFFTLILRYRGGALFLCLLLKYIGVPLPGETLLLSGGFLSTGAGTAVSIAAATAGTFFGSMAAYMIGRRYGERALLFLGRPFHLTKERLGTANAAFEKHKALYITLSRFVPVARHIVPYWSGIAGVSAAKNALYNLISAMIWCAAFILLGRAAGRDWVLLNAAVGTYSLIALALIALVFAALIYLKRYKSTVLLFSSAFTAFMLLSSQRMEAQLAPFDNRIYLLLASFISFRMTAVMRVLSDLGSFYALAMISAILLTFLAVRHRHLFYGFSAGVNLLLVTLLNILFKLIFHRARPNILQLISAPGYSFPSGHSMVSAAFYGYLAYLCLVFLKKPARQVTGCLLGALILLIGISRIYLGVHFASDVICGLFAGLAWLVMYIAVTETLFDKPHRCRL